MTSARKGKACIISLSQFEVDWLQPLVGYKTDEMRLCELWDQMGFDVYTPKVEGRSLTAEVQSSSTIYPLTPYTL